MKTVWILYWSFGDGSGLEIAFAFEDGEKARSLAEILQKYDIVREWKCVEMQVTA